jgi:hypothetical protein
LGSWLNGTEAASNEGASGTAWVLVPPLAAESVRREAAVRQA